MLLEIPDNGKFSVDTTDGFIFIYDDYDNCIYEKHPGGHECWQEYDPETGVCIHMKNSDGVEMWYTSGGKQITEQEFNNINNS